MNGTPQTTTPQLSLPLRRTRAGKVGFAAALAIVVKVGRESPLTARCPRCGKVGRVDRDFGTRVLDGRRRTQSWCRDCRAGRCEAPRADTPDESGWLFAH